MSFFIFNTFFIKSFSDCEWWIFELLLLALFSSKKNCCKLYHFFINHKIIKRYAVNISGLEINELQVMRRHFHLFSTQLEKMNIQIYGFMNSHRYKGSNKLRNLRRDGTMSWVVWVYYKQYLQLKETHNYRATLQFLCSRIEY